MSAAGSTGLGLGVGVGVIGLGFMGRTHVAAYRAAHAAGHANRLAAVCDADEARRRGAGDGGGNLATGAETERIFVPVEEGGEVVGYATPEELLADPRVELVSICTPTDSHVDLAVAALGANKHVLVEKPVALSHAEVARLGVAARAAAERGVLCMPALCMRFWPGWVELKAAVSAHTYGAPVSFAAQRLASPPSWNPDFYKNTERTGGALVDLHIHDTDFVHHLFGMPESVSSAGTVDHVTTAYRYDSGSGGPAGPRHVVAEGGWDHTPGFAFRMRYVAVFEHATLDFDLTRADPLLLCTAGEATPVALASHAGYDGEIRHLLDAIAGRCELAATIADAEAHARLLDAERTSLATGAPVRIHG